MKRSLPALLLAFMVGPHALRAADIATQFKDLVVAHEKAGAARDKAMRAAKGEAEKRKAYAEETAKMRAFSPRFLELAQKTPKDVAALDALLWITENDQAGTTFAQAADILIRDHVTSDRIAKVCEDFNPFEPATAKLLRAILDKNPKPDVQAAAALGLAQALKGIAEEAAQSRQQSAAEQRDQVERAADYYGKETAERIFARVRASDPDAVSREAEKYYTLVLEKFADVGGRRGPAAKAKGELFELRNLAIGKVAPEIEGEDLDGKKFKLTDYRGKVVVIDFFGDW